MYTLYRHSPLTHIPHSMGRDVQPLRQSKTAVSKTSCDIIYDIDWEIMTSDIAKVTFIILCVYKLLCIAFLIIKICDESSNHGLFEHIYISFHCQSNVSCHVLAYPVLSCVVLCCVVLYCITLSCLVLSCHVLNCLEFTCLLPLSVVALGTSISISCDERTTI